MLCESIGFSLSLAIHADVHRQTATKALVNRVMKPSVSGATAATRRLKLNVAGTRHRRENASALQTYLEISRWRMLGLVGSRVESLVRESLIVAYTRVLRYVGLFPLGFGADQAELPRSPLGTFDLPDIAPSDHALPLRS
jgi:hypothetical protein